MPSIAIPRPASDEYEPYYASYISRVSEGNALAGLERQKDATLAVLGGIPAVKEEYRYAPGKWSVKELVGHVVDSERIFAYRALCVARGERNPLPGFDENAYARAGGFDRRTLADLAAEYGDVRRATLALFGGFDPEALSRRGTANDKTVTPRAIAWIIAGHELHHLETLRSRYL